jgi:hypothetical protein
VADLYADGQDDAAECAEQTVAAWRARANAVAADVGTAGLRSPRFQLYDEPSIFRYMTSYDVASNIRQARYPPRHRHAFLHHRFFSEMTSYHLASTIHRSLPGGGGSARGLRRIGGNRGGCGGAAHGMAVQVGAVQPEPPGTKRLKLNYDESL